MNYSVAEFAQYWQRPSFAILLFGHCLQNLRYSFGTLSSGQRKHDPSSSIISSASQGWQVVLIPFGNSDSGHSSQLPSILTI